jgi:hypothetical protein
MHCGPCNAEASVDFLDRQKFALGCFSLARDFPLTAQAGDVMDLERIPTVTTALWGCLVARNAYAYS